MAQNQGITQTESWFANEQLHKEQLCLKKCGIYANQIQDPQLKGSIQRMMNSCQKHLNALQGMVGTAGQNLM
ncbi:MAG: hypothetical protein VB144_03070 [Clostridia bacterium]|nr:hypothetical protein [Clostridia bacterium]